LHSRHNQLLRRLPASLTRAGATKTKVLILATSDSLHSFNRRTVESEKHASIEYQINHQGKSCDQLKGSCPEQARIDPICWK
jgi:hypothetical protein